MPADRPGSPQPRLATDPILEVSGLSVEYIMDRSSVLAVAQPSTAASYFHLLRRQAYARRRNLPASGRPLTGQHSRPPRITAIVLAQRSG